MCLHLCTHHCTLYICVSPFLCRTFICFLNLSSSKRGLLSTHAAVWQRPASESWIHWATHDAVEGWENITDCLSGFNLWRCVIKWCVRCCCCIILIWQRGCEAQLYILALFPLQKVTTNKKYLQETHVYTKMVTYNIMEKCCLWALFHSRYFYLSAGETQVELILFTTAPFH